MVLGHAQGLTLSVTMAWRYVVATPFLLVLAGSDLRRLTLGRTVWLLTAGGLGQVAISGMSLYSLRWLDVATLGFLFYTYPAWVALIAVVRGIERVDARRALALTIALGGLVVILGAPRTNALPIAGVAFALSAAMIYAAYIPFLHWLRGPLSAATASALVIAGAGIAYTIGAVWRGEFTTSLTVAGWAVIIAMAVGSTVMAFIAFLNGLAVLGPVRTAIISTIEPFYTAVLGTIVLHQSLGVGTVIGGALIAAAVLILQVRPPRAA